MATTTRKTTTRKVVKKARMASTMSRPIASKRATGHSKEEGMKRNTKPKKATVHKTVRKAVAHPKVKRRVTKNSK